MFRDLQPFYLWKMAQFCASKRAHFCHFIENGTVLCFEKSTFWHIMEKGTYFVFRLTNDENVTKIELCMLKIILGEMRK